MAWDLTGLFRSKIKALEMLSLIEGTKPCARIMVHERDLKKVLDFFSENKIHTAISGFKVKKESSNSHYSDKSMKINPNSNEKGHFFVYASKTKELAENAKKHESEGKHFELGIALGYPKCCCRFFTENFSEDSYDLTLKTLRNSQGDFHFQNNIAARHFDFSLLFHFPCSFDCRESLRISKTSLEILENSSKETAALFVKKLKSGIIYTKGNGVFLLEEYEKEGNKIKIIKITGTADNGLFNGLSNAGEFEFDKDKKISVEGKEKEAYFLEFT
ncbi:hypothetical protein J4212_04565 [Candidatus Woesearchaeota archaeon]|nr:hypothetical protein [Candidatus Woesearchaeota archaeon]